MHFQALDGKNFDVVVVGARCAGASVAMLLARAGARVLVVDRQPYGSDTLSTHALMRPAAMQLARWGLFERILAGGAPLITETSFHYGDETVRIAIRPQPGLPGLIAPRRAVLDRLLVDAAREAGAEIVHEVIADSLVWDRHGRVIGLNLRGRDKSRASITAGIVVGADGIGSTVARQAGAEIQMRARHAVANLFAYARGHGAIGYDWYYRSGMASGAIPTHDGEACIFVSVPMDRFDAELRHDPEAGHFRILRETAPILADRVSLSAFSPIRAFRGVKGFLRQAHGPGWVLAGDAGFFRDPLTAHGISDAFRDAEGAAKAILSGTVAACERYAQARDHFARQITETTDAICSFDWGHDELKAHHKRLSEIMKEEEAALSQGFGSQSSPAPAEPFRRSA